MSLADVVSVDMFQTLVDVNSMRYYLWRKILGKNYSETLADDYTKQWSRLFPDHFKNAVSKADDFLCLKPIFERFNADFLPQLGLDFNPEHAAQIHVEIHGMAPPYEDTEVFLKTMREHFTICLVTDSDNEMILPHLDKYRFDQIFISERLKTYKSDPGNKMFKAVISHYSIPPERIFHIGDMYSDILGASKADITTCWLNREGKNWDYSIKPDYEAESLLEAADILGKPIR
ncbi:MAG: HAD family hydrolase [Desulfobacterales bacterium]|jgi:putative hydrolase of the HAD superfamily